MRRVSAGCDEDAGMNVYLSTAQAKSIVLQLMQIFPEGVSLCDEDGVILSLIKEHALHRAHQPHLAAGKAVH